MIIMITFYVLKDGVVERITYDYFNRVHMIKLLTHFKGCKFYQLSKIAGWRVYSSSDNAWHLTHADYVPAEIKLAEILDESA